MSGPLGREGASRSKKYSEVWLRENLTLENEITNYISDKIDK